MEHKQLWRCELHPNQIPFTFCIVPASIVSPFHLITFILGTLVAVAASPLQGFPGCCTLDLLIIVVSDVFVTVAAVKSQVPMSGFKVFFYSKR